METILRLHSIAVEYCCYLLPSNQTRTAIMNLVLSLICKPNDVCDQIVEYDDAHGRMMLSLGVHFVELLP